MPRIRYTSSAEFDLLKRRLTIAEENPAAQPFFRDLGFPLIGSRLVYF